MSKAKTLAQRVADRVALVTVANGYLTDIGLRVLRGRLALDESFLPCAVVVEGDDSIEDQTEIKAKVAQAFIVEGHAECDPDNPNDTAHDIVADLKRAIFDGDRTFEGFVPGPKGLRYNGKNFGTRPDGTNVVAASIQFTCVFVEDLTNP